MTKNLHKNLYIIFTFVFVFGMVSIGIAGFFDKSILQKVVKTIVIEEPHEQIETIPASTGTSSAVSSTVSNDSNGNAVSVNTSPGTSSNATSSTPTPVATPSGYTAAQVAAHNSQGNCWIIVSGVVYDLSSYRHSGPQSHISCGGDNTSALTSAHGSLSFVSFFTKLGNLI